jgi:hypothetical protein
MNHNTKISEVDIDSIKLAESQSINVASKLAVNNLQNISDTLVHRIPSLY